MSPEQIPNVILEKSKEDLLFQITSYKARAKTCPLSVQEEQYVLWLELALQKIL